ncbi:MAG: nucleotidyl transferase AbiEii/AbiGii toxin family protein [Acidimicrobiales bacterium]
MTPSRDSTSGRTYIDLQKKARADGRPVQELFQLYILETFLDRLSRSPDRESFVLKGGVLLAAFGVRRPTRDVDLQATALSSDAEVVRQRMVEVAAIEIDDGVVFDTSSATAEGIRDDDAYPGVRVSMAATLLPAKHRFHVDVNTGDPASPPTTPSTATPSSDRSVTSHSTAAWSWHRSPPSSTAMATSASRGGRRGGGSNRSKIECPKPSQTSSRHLSRSPTRPSVPTRSDEGGTRLPALGPDLAPDGPLNPMLNLESQMRS